MHTVAVLSQKGGVGKSTIARLLATTYARAHWRVKIADFHLKQVTCVEWSRKRLAAEIEPAVPAEAFVSVKKAVAQRTHYDLMVFDGRPNSDASTLEIARESDLIVIPTGVALADLRPQVKLAHELLSHGVKREAILFVVNMSLDSAASISDARSFVEAAGYTVATNDLPFRTGYLLVQNIGRALNESAYPSLNERADALVQEIVDRLTVTNSAHSNVTKLSFCVSFSIEITH